MVIALTGGMGCGKSVALEIFAGAGAETLSSDAIVAELMDKDAGVREALAERFGQGVFDEEGRVDKREIGHIVFNNSQELVWLENLLHPLVKKYREACVAQAPDALWVVEIPLLFEKKLEKQFDFTVCVSCCLDIQLERLKNRGISEEEARKRISRQLALAEKIRRADFVLSNNGSLEFFRKQILCLKDKLSPV